VLFQEVLQDAALGGAVPGGAVLGDVIREDTVLRSAFLGVLLARSTVLGGALLASIS
jgi:hypothetical protein